MLVVNIASYRFVPLDNLVELRTAFQQKCRAFSLKGTILLSQEGININLAGSRENTALFQTFLQTDTRFANMRFHETESNFLPFKYTKIKIKKEIITMRVPNIHPEIKRAPDIAPQTLKQWLDEKRDITILDTRNDYEIQFGTFKNAVNLHLNDFGEFSKATKKLNPNKPVVMFCTGGIRCEKAALHLLQEGFQQVFQLQNGILNYFKEVGNAYYEGECFVFDERIALDANLSVTGTKQCKHCQGPVKDAVNHTCEK